MKTLSLLTLILAFLCLSSLGICQEEMAKVAHEDTAYMNASCMGCHGQSAMGGLGPPIVKIKLTPEEFLKVVREGKGMMPLTKPEDLPDEKVNQIHGELQQMEWKESQIPIAYKVGQMLTTKGVSHIFLTVFLFSFIAACFGLRYWLRNAGFAQMWPRMVKMGLGKSFGIALRAFIVDGLFVASLWRKDRFRWFMHGLIFYGFLGLLLGDVLLAINNPQRTQLPLGNPIALFPILCGLAALTGVFYVMVRYKKDEYIDNGLTLGKDFWFVSLLLHTLFSGFLTILFKRLNIFDWVMTIYIYHLISIALLIGTAPWTRFMHVWVVPIMVACTRLTEAVTASGVDIGFEREPSPGRHHKTERIADDVLAQLGPDYEGPRRIRYYP